MCDDKRCLGVSSGQKKDTRSSNVGGTEGGLNPGDHVSRIRLRKTRDRSVRAN